MGKKSGRHQPGPEARRMPGAFDTNRDIRSGNPDSVRAILAVCLARLAGHDFSDDSRENLQQVCSERYARTVIESAQQAVPAIEAAVQSDHLESRLIGLGQMTRLVGYAEQLRYALSIAGRSGDQVQGLMRELRQSLGSVLMKPEKLVGQASRPDQKKYNPRDLAMAIHTLLTEADYGNAQGIGQVGVATLANEMTRYLMDGLSHNYLGKYHDDVLTQERLRVDTLRYKDIDYTQDALLAWPDRLALLRPNSFFRDIHQSLQRNKRESSRVPYVQAIFDERHPKHRESLDNYRALMSSTSLGVLSITVLNYELMFAGVITQPVTTKEMQRHFKDLALPVNRARRDRWEQAQALTNHHAGKVFKGGGESLTRLRYAVTHFREIVEFNHALAAIERQARNNPKSGFLNDDSCERDLLGHPIAHVVELMDWEEPETNKAFPELPELKPEILEAVTNLADALAHDIERSRDPYESIIVELMDQEHHLFIGAEPHFPESELTLIAPEHILKVKLDAQLQVVGDVPAEFHDRMHLIRALALAQMYDQLFAYALVHRAPRPESPKRRPPETTGDTQTEEEVTATDTPTSEAAVDPTTARKLTVTQHYLVINEATTDNRETDYQVTEKDNMATLIRKRRSHWMELEGQTMVLPARQYAWESVKGRLVQAGFSPAKINLLEQTLLHPDSHLYPASQIIRSILQPQLLRPGLGLTELDQRLPAIIEQFEYLERRTYAEKFNQSYDLSEDGRFMQRINGMEDRLTEAGLDPEHIPPHLRPTQTFRKSHPVEMQLPIEGGIARKKGVYTIIRANNATEALLALLSKQ